MRKNGADFLFAVILYTTISSAFISMQFLCAVFLVKILRFVALTIFSNLAGLEKIVYDAAGFSALTLTSTVAHYFLASLLSGNLAGNTFWSRKKLFLTIFAGAVFASALFMRLARGSDFAHYDFSFLPITAAIVLGGGTAIFQKESGNLFKDSRFNLFKK